MPGTSDPRERTDAELLDELLADQGNGPATMLARVLAVLIVLLAFALILVAIRGA